MTTTATLPAFGLDDLAGDSHSFPGGRPTLLCFVKEDCPTCRLTMPLLQLLHHHFSGGADVWAVGQEAAGNRVLAADFSLTLPLLDDSALSASFAFDIETVPALFLADSSGARLAAFVGFDQDDWRAVVESLSDLSGLSQPAIDWSAYPQQRPGCGSRSVEPGIAERLQAEARGEKPRARVVEISEREDAIEWLYEQGFSDGLPLVPPTPERVERMLSGTDRQPDELVAVVPPNMGEATVEKVAANAVMAGCRPEYLPVVIAALQAVCADEFNIHGVMATTWGATPVVVVNGPIRQRIGMNMGVAALGSGNRANATIGRALKLTLRNVGGAKPDGIERSTLATPAKYTMCFAEWEERSPWPPLHVERGFKPEESVVTVFALEGPRGIADQTSRSARALGGSLGLGLEAAMHPRIHFYGEALLVVSPEHADTLWKERWSKDDLRARIQEITARPLAELLADEEAGDGMQVRWYGPGGPTPEQLEQAIPKFRQAEQISIVVAGGEAGKFSAVFGGWVSGPAGSLRVSRRIEEPT